MIIKFNGGKKGQINHHKSILDKMRKMRKINKINLNKSKLKNLRDQIKSLNLLINLLDMFKKLLQFQSAMINYLCFQQELIDASNFGV